jgi:hypothetical protein
MPAKSKAQQKAAGAALSAKRGETKTGALKGASRQMFETMNETQLDELASTKRKGKPDHVEDGRKSAAKSSAKRAVKSRPRSAKKTSKPKAKKAVKKASPRKQAKAKRTRQ